MPGKLTDRQRALVEDNLNLVHFCIRRKFPDFTLNRIEYDEMVSVGTIGLMKAAMAYKDGCGDAFSSYGVNGAAFEILRYLKTKRRKWGHVFLIDDMSVKADADGGEDVQMDCLAYGNDPALEERGYARLEDRMTLDCLIGKCRFTEREQQMLDQMLEGNNAKEAGREMGVTHQRAKNLKSAVYRKIRRAGEPLVKGYYL